MHDGIRKRSYIKIAAVVVTHLVASLLVCLPTVKHIVHESSLLMSFLMLLFLLFSDDRQFVQRAVFMSHSYFRGLRADGSGDSPGPVSHLPERPAQPSGQLSPTTQPASSIQQCSSKPFLFVYRLILVL